VPELRVHNLPTQIAPDALAGSTVVVIDLLRATSSICQALAAGATEVVPFLEVEDAIAAWAKSHREKVVLGGERHGQRIDGFDLGNSPSEYTPASVGGRRVFITTTNGTRALDHARQASRVLLGSFLNLSAVVASLQGAARIDILCAGTDGAESREDILAAGAIVEMLTANVSSDWQLDEGATEALAQWRSRGDDLAFDLRSTPGGRNLLEIGMDDDLVDCARIDTLAVVPELNVSTWQITAG
jgi:2-phosphosulfolactate phosphatase